MPTDKSVIDSLCFVAIGKKPVSVVRLPKAGGDRTYYRVSIDTASEIRYLLAVISDNDKDARAFIALSDIFSKRGVNVPRVLYHESDYSAYLVEDLGTISLFDLLGSDNSIGLIEKTMRELVKMQTVSINDWRSAVVYKPFSRRQIMWDLNYFKYEFLKNTQCDFDEDKLEDDFELLAAKLLDIPEQMYCFMMRDCQSRNVMVKDGKPWFIDFQGGRLGPGIYDAVSFLWQAKADFSDTFRKEMISVYVEEFSKIRQIKADEIFDRVALFALFRTLQVLGAYGFRGLVQKRAHFIESIPGALHNLSLLLESDILEPYPELKRVVRRISSDSRFLLNSCKEGKLHVKVFSFSYKKGYPEDLSGNGGGFMFDCRGMHNPGRYDRYKNLTGRDQPVIDFLKERGEVDLFVDKALAIVSPTIERYIQRGFSSLQIGFGCTGGQHRSVYCAEATAHALSGKFPEIVVELIHREQNI